MKKADVLKHFGSVKATAEALSISHVAVVRWGEEIPEGRAYQLQILTGGVLQHRNKQPKHSAA